MVVSPLLDNKNDKDADVWVWTCLSETGSYHMVQTLRNVFKTEVLQRFELEEGLWAVMFKNPLKNDVC